jgi:iron complex outermembrane receptor protein
MKINFLAILVLTSTYTLAQHSISGYVTDHSNNKGLIGANVSINGNTSSLTATDDNGYFEFTDLAEGKYKLEISYVGYETFNQTLSVPAGKELEIELIEAPYLNDAVVVIPLPMVAQV